MDRHPPGVVGVIAQDTARFTMFAASLTGLDVPEETEIVWRFGHSISAQTNDLVRGLLDRPKAEWLWILGDDHSFSPGILRQLLDVELTNGAPDIIVPLCLTRMPPYAPVIFDGFLDDGRRRRRVNLDDYCGGGVIAIHSAGSGGMLVRRHVFEAMEPPWFEGYQVSSQEISEDVVFCDKAREIGCQLYCDLDASLGHCLSAVVWPVRERDGWTRGFSMMGGFHLRMPHSTR